MRCGVERVEDYVGISKGEPSCFMRHNATLLVDHKTFSVSKRVDGHKTVCQTSLLIFVTTLYKVPHAHLLYIHAQEPNTIRKQTTHRRSRSHSIIRFFCRPPRESLDLFLVCYAWISRDTKADHQSLYTYIERRIGQLYQPRPLTWVILTYFLCCIYVGWRIEIGFVGG